MPYAQVNALSLAALAVRCPRLRALRLARCEHVSDEGMEHLVGLPLTALDLSHCKGEVTDLNACMHACMESR